MASTTTSKPKPRQIKPGTKLALTPHSHYDTDTTLATYNGVSYTTPISINGTTLQAAVSIMYADSFVKCASFPGDVCKQSCPARTKGPGCFVSSNATLEIPGGNGTGAASSVLIQDLAMGFAKGTPESLVRLGDLNSIDADAALGLGGATPISVDHKYERLGAVSDNYSLSLADSAPFVMFSGVDEELIKQQQLTPITLPIQLAFLKIGMTAFHVDNGNSSSTMAKSGALYPGIRTGPTGGKDTGVYSHLTMGMSYIAMPDYIFSGFAATFLARHRTGCDDTLATKQQPNSQNKLYVCPSEIKLPRLGFTFGDATFYLDGKDYVTPLPSDPSKVVVELTATSFGSQWDLGLPFLKKFYMAYRDGVDVTIYCHSNIDCASGVVENPPRTSVNDDAYARVRSYFNIEDGWSKPSTTTTEPSSSSGDNTSSGSTNLFFFDPIFIVVAILVVVVVAFRVVRRQSKRRQAAMAEADAAAAVATEAGEVIPTPVQETTAGKTVDGAPYHAEPAGAR